MTDLERVRNRIAMHLSADTLEMFDAHLKEDAVRDRTAEYNFLEAEKVPKLQAELARLRKKLDWFVRRELQYDALVNELDRLREERDQLEKMRYDAALEAEEALEDNDRLREGNARLREEVKRVGNLYTEASIENAKLREENEAQATRLAIYEEDFAERTSQRDTLLAALRKIANPFEKNPHDIARATIEEIEGPTWCPTHGMGVHECEHGSWPISEVEGETNYDPGTAGHRGAVGPSGRAPIRLGPNGELWLSEVEGS